MKPAIERFLSKISISDSGCWEWQSSTDKNNYGRFSPYHSKTIRAHRFIYEYYHGEIDGVLTIHHVCYNTCCVNPNHLKEISKKSNVLDGSSPSSVNKRKTHCKYYHEYNDLNTRIASTGQRICVICNSRFHKISRLINKDKIQLYHKQRYQLLKSTIGK